MGQRKSSELIAILRKTLEEVQESIWRDSAAIQEMKRGILRAIADLESDEKQPLTQTAASDTISKTRQRA